MTQKKKCTRCGKEKSLEQFKLNKSGLSNRCKLCKKVQGKDKFRNLSLRMLASECGSIENKAETSGYSVVKYLIWLHEKNMEK